TANGVRPRKSTPCSSLRRATKLGLFSHWFERRVSDPFYFCGNKNAPAFAPEGGRRYRGEWGKTRLAGGGICAKLRLEIVSPTARCIRRGLRLAVSHFDESSLSPPLRGHREFH